MSKPSRSTKIITAIFLFALLMGPGPGAALIDGSAEAPNFIFGIPALYLWLVLWFLVMAGCVIAAAKLIWSNE